MEIRKADLTIVFSTCENLRVEWNGPLSPQSWGFTSRNIFGEFVTFDHYANKKSWLDHCDQHMWKPQGEMEWDLNHPRFLRPGHKSPHPPNARRTRETDPTTALAKCGNPRVSQNRPLLWQDLGAFLHTLLWPPVTPEPDRIKKNQPHHRDQHTWKP